MYKTKMELSPCPICGGKVSSRVRHIGTNCRTEIFNLDIYCNNSNCGVVKSKRFEVCDTSFDKVIEAIDNAVSSWNKRTDKYEDDGK